MPKQSIALEDDDESERSSLSAPRRDISTKDVDVLEPGQKKQGPVTRRHSDGRDDRKISAAGLSSNAPNVSAGNERATDGGGNVTPTGIAQAAQHSDLRSHDAVMPGAVAVRGSNESVVSLPSVLSLPSASENVPNNELPDALIIEAHVVEDVNAEVENRLLQREDEIADHVLNRFRENVVEAEMVEIDDKVSGNDEEMLSKRKRRNCIVGFVLGALVVVIVVIVVAVVLTQNKSPSPTPPAPSPSPPSPPPTILPPTISPATMTPTSTSPVSPALPPLQSNLSATVLQLIENAANYTLLAQYLNQYPFLTVLVSSQTVTLLAPTDDSFQALQKSAYQYYFLGSTSSWSTHFYLLLSAHVVTQNLTFSQIFQTTLLPTWLTSLSLNVNITSMTVENGARIVEKDIQASNGLIQVPDRVIIYSTLRYTLLDNVMETSIFVFSEMITKFRSLLDQSGLQGTLLQILPFGLSLFVPTDSAFDSLNSSISALLFSSPKSNFTRELILYHMTPYNLFSFVAPSESIRFMSNNVSAWLTTNNPQNQTFINQAAINNSYVVQNGYIHITDQVLVPPNIAELLQIATDFTTGFNLTTFLGIVEGPAGLGNLFRAEVEGYPILGKYGDKYYLTAFAHVERAFAKLRLSRGDAFERWLQPSWLLHLQSVVLQHFTVDTFLLQAGNYRTLRMLSGFTSNLQVISAGDDFRGGNNKTIDGNQVDLIPGTVASDVTAENGLVFTIEGVLLPHWVDQSIYSQLDQDANLTTLTSLVDSSALFTTLLNGTDGPLTLLAPNDAAFANVSSRVDTSNATFVQELLSRHVILGNVYAPIQNPSVISWGNQMLKVETHGNDTFVGGARLLAVNNLRSNGVIHVIDRVLL